MNRWNANAMAEERFLNGSSNHIDVPPEDKLKNIKSTAKNGAPDDDDDDDDRSLSARLDSSLRIGSTRYVSNSRADSVSPLSPNGFFLPKSLASEKSNHDSILTTETESMTDTSAQSYDPILLCISTDNSNHASAQNNARRTSVFALGELYEDSFRSRSSHDPSPEYLPESEIRPYLGMDESTTEVAQRRLRSDRINSGNPEPPFSSHRCDGAYGGFYRQSALFRVDRPGRADAQPNEPRYRGEQPRTPMDICCEDSCDEKRSDQNRPPHGDDCGGPRSNHGCLLHDDHNDNHSRLPREDHVDAPRPSHRRRFHREASHGPYLDHRVRMCYEEDDADRIHDSRHSRVSVSSQGPSRHGRHSRPPSMDDYYDVYQTRPGAILASGHPDIYNLYGSDRKARWKDRHRELHLEGPRGIDATRGGRSEKPHSNGPPLYSERRNGHSNEPRKPVRNRSRSPGADLYEEAVYLEIGHGVKARLRRARETQEAIARDFFSPMDCLGCSKDLFCIADAKYLICPVCRSVSPCGLDESRLERERGANRYGVGLGFTRQTLYEVQSEIYRNRASTR